MKISSGIYNNHGYVQIRIWPWDKTTKPKPYTEKGFGCWCEVHIKDAERRLRAIRDDIDSGKFFKDQEGMTISFVQACDLYLLEAFTKNPTRSKYAETNVKYFLNRFKARWPTIRFNDFTPKEVKEYRNDRIAAGKANSSVKREMMVLSAVFNAIRDWSRSKEIIPVKLPDFNPVDPIDKPDTSQSGRTRVATWDELTAVKRYCEANDPDFALLIEGALTSLLRKQELLRMQGAEKLDGFAGKTGKAFHLPGSFRTPARVKNFRRRWDTIREACNMKDFHWHDWKHTGATLMRMDGASIELLNEMMEHSDLKTTRIYTNAQAERFAPAINKLKEHWRAL